MSVAFLLNIVLCITWPISCHKSRLESIGSTASSSAMMKSKHSIVRPGVFTTVNINASFAGADLIPYNPGRALDRLHFQSDMTPSGSSHSKSSSSWTAETPKTTKDLKKQGGLVRHLLGRRTASPCPVNQAVNQVIKGCEIAMNNAVLLDHEVHHLRMANQRQKRKWETSKIYIASGGVLTGAERHHRASRRIRSLPFIRDYTTQTG